MEIDRRRIIKVSLLIVIPVLLLVLLFNAPSIITISSDEGAAIAIADSKDGSFKKIGTTKTTHFFFKKPANIYISADLQGKQSITSAQFKRFTRQSVDLRLANTVSAKKISSVAVVNAIFDNNKGQGIVYGQNTLINFNADMSPSDPNPEFLGLPYIKKIVWYDFNTFVYQTAEGMGQFISGNNKGMDNVGSSTVGDVSIDTTDTTPQGGPLIIDIARVTNKPLVLLSSTNIFTSTNLGTKLQAITSFDRAGSETHVFTSGENIFRTVSPPETKEAKPNQKSQKPQINVEEYSYEGKKLRTTQLDDTASVVGIVKRGNTTYVLTTSKLHIIKAGTVQKTDLYFAAPADITLYKNQVVVLAKDGLWKIADDNTTFQLAFKFTANGVGLKNSMSVTANNQLLFGTTPADNSDTSNNATFVTSF